MQPGTAAVPSVIQDLRLTVLRWHRSGLDDALLQQDHDGAARHRRDVSQNFGACFATSNVTLVRAVYGAPVPTSNMGTNFRPTTSLHGWSRGGEARLTLPCVGESESHRGHDYQTVPQQSGPRRAHQTVGPRTKPLPSRSWRARCCRAPKRRPRSFRLVLDAPPRRAHTVRPDVDADRLLLWSSHRVRGRRRAQG